MPCNLKPLYGVASLLLLLHILLTIYRRSMRVLAFRVYYMHLRNNSGKCTAAQYEGGLSRRRTRPPAVARGCGETCGSKDGSRRGFIIKKRCYLFIGALFFFLNNPGPPETSPFPLHYALPI